MKKIKVLHLTSTRYGIGGVEKLLLDMSEIYDLSNFEFLYCNLFCDQNGDGAFPLALRAKGLKQFNINGSRMINLPRIVFELAKLIKLENVDVIHTHMLQATIIGQLVAMLFRRGKRIVTRHYTDVEVVNRRIYYILDKYVTQRCSDVIAVSNSVKRDLMFQGISESRISVVHNGIDLTGFDNAASQSADILPKLKENTYIVGCVGSLMKRKGHDWLIKAFSLVLKHHENARLLIAGEGPEYANLKNLTKQLRLENEVRLIGFHGEIPKFLKEIDLFVQPSRSESFGISVLEAMAAEKCVIASNTGGIPEIVIDGQTGILVEPGNVKELANAISEVMSNPSKYKQFGHAGRNLVETKFNVANTVKGYQSAYS